MNLKDKYTQMRKKNNTPKDIKCKGGKCKSKKFVESFDNFDDNTFSRSRNTLVTFEDELYHEDMHIADYVINQIQECGSNFIISTHGNVKDVYDAEKLHKILWDFIDNSTEWTLETNESSKSFILDCDDEVEIYIPSEDVLDCANKIIDYDKNRGRNRHQSPLNANDLSSKYNVDLNDVKDMIECINNDDEMNENIAHDCSKYASIYNIIINNRDYLDDIDFDEIYDNLDDYIVDNDVDGDYE